MALKRSRKTYESDLSYTFRCYGHGNIRARHEKTIEFTKDSEISVKGDCIIGVRAEFDVERLKAFRDKVLLIIECEGLQDEFHAIVSSDFSDERELVLRKSRVSTPRTFGVMLNKGAAGLKRDIGSRMKDPDAVITVTIYQKPVRKVSEERTG